MLRFLGRAAALYGENQENIMKNETKCACSKASEPIIACSGASYVGEITDRAARLMTKNDTRKCSDSH